MKPLIGLRGWTFNASLQFSEMKGVPDGKQSSRTWSKVLGFVCGVFFLLVTYFSGFRLYERLMLARSAAHHQEIGFALDIGGNSLLLVMGVLGVVAVFRIARRGLDEIIRDWPYVTPGILVAVFAASMGAVYARQMTWVLPAAAVWALMALCIGWSILRQHGLPINARVSDMAAARER